MTIINQRIRNQAAKWFARMQNAEADHPDRSKFDAWLMESPAHANEYSAIAAVWDDFDSTAKMQALAQAMAQKNSDMAKQRKHYTTMANKAALMVLVMVFSFFGYQGWVEWQAQPLMQMAKNSGIAEIIQQELPDGSQLTLNANTEMDIIYYRDKRVIKLKRGEAIFEVSKDANRPFVVDSGIAKVTVLGTRFAVNQIDGRVVVAVDHGRVQVETKPSSGAAEMTPVVLSNGQMAEVRPNTSPVFLERNAMDAFGFSSGRLVFENASLNEVAETLSRYRLKPIVAIGKNSKQPHITAVMNVAETESFLKTLPQIAAVEVKQNQNQTLLISKKIGRQK